MNEFILSEELLKKAGEGDIFSQIELGKTYLGVNENDKATFWLEKAVKQKSAEACYILGDCFLYEYDDKGKAIELYEKGSSLGSSDAPLSLGLIYAGVTLCDYAGYREEERNEFSDEGEYDDFKKAFENFTLAYERGNVLAIHMLGRMYHRGKGVIKDINKAFSFYEIAYGKGDIDGCYCLGELYYFGDGEFSKKKKIGLGYIKEAADNGHSYAQNLLSSIYYDKKDYKNAYVWAVKSDTGASKVRAGLMLLNGKGVKKNPKEAIKMFKKTFLYFGLDSAHDALAQLMRINFLGIGYKAPRMAIAKRYLIEYLTYYEYQFDVDCETVSDVVYGLLLMYEGLNEHQIDEDELDYYISSLRHR